MCGTNSAGRYEIPAGQDSSDQGFCAAGDAGAQIDDRLVDDEQLPALERCFEIAHDSGVDASSHERSVVHRVPLRRVHVPVCPCKKLLARRSVLREHGPADAAVDLDGSAIHEERAAERVTEATDEYGGGLVRAGSGGDHDELVAADSGNGVALAQDRLEASCERLQHVVAGVMAAHVVDVLEAVEVDDDHGERLVGAPRPAECLLDAVLEEHAVGEPGERVVKGARMRAIDSPVQDDAARGGGAGEEHDRRGDVLGAPS